MKLIKEMEKFLKILVIVYCEEFKIKRLFVK